MATGTQTLATEVPTGKIGVWWFLASEIPVFGGLIVAYVVLRLGGAGWSEASSHLNVYFALVNTFVLLTSSLTMVLAFAEIERERLKRAQACLLLTILLGILFLAIKGVEYAGEIGNGFTPGAGIFWSFYYGMTGLHALHVLAGIVVNLILYAQALSGALQRHSHRVELAGLYWHFVDVVWIFLFPLLYLT